MDSQKVIDEVIVANADAIKRINKEIKELTDKDTCINLPKETFENEDCMERCKWFKRESGCNRSNCEYLHNTLATHDGYKCAGCLDIWNDPTCVIKHLICNQEIYFCLNCNDWIKEKSRVFDQGLTLLDEQGLPRTGI